MQRAMSILAKHGLNLDNLVEAGFELYVHATEDENTEDKRKRLKELLSIYLEDPNVWLLIAAASYLDELVSSNGSSPSTPSGDPASLVADELIGMSIAEYIAGKKGLFNYVRYDREKPGAIGDLPPFMDDAVGALVAASMTRVFE
ncbi:MAG: alpha-ribazole phosphatase CobZ [Methanobacteriota archaeon]|nr:MAG: alpha-ribazole phosphatase CobZ [Euryarchaeota archaeon]